VPMTLSGSRSTHAQELDRQIETLVARGYPAAAGLSERAFRRRLAPLAARLEVLPARKKMDRVPFVIVVGSALVPRAAAVPLMALRGKRGFTDMPADDLERFAPTERVAPRLPTGPVYLVTDLDTGADTLDVTPEDALKTIVRRRRSPLTIEEGVALITHYPELLKSKNCFSILGSRCGDRRVPALWVSKGHPRLGWCWAANPHTWLGSASCGGRMDLSSWR
jgi:hypothetical protein